MGSRPAQGGISSPHGALHDLLPSLSEAKLFCLQAAYGEVPRAHERSPPPPLFLPLRRLGLTGEPAPAVQLPLLRAPGRVREKNAPALQKHLKILYRSARKNVINRPDGTNVCSFSSGREENHYHFCLEA